MNIFFASVLLQVSDCEASKCFLGHNANPHSSSDSPYRILRLVIEFRWKFNRQEADWLHTEIKTRSIFTRNLEYWRISRLRTSRVVSERRRKSLAYHRRTAFNIAHGIGQSWHNKISACPITPARHTPIFPNSTNQEGQVEVHRTRHRPHTWSPHSTSASSSTWSMASWS